MTRVLDVGLSLIGLILCAPILALLWVIGWLENGSPLFRQERVGRYQKPFILVKFRTMRLDTASVATHLADASAVTPFGRLLRLSKLDELPQLWNVLKGEMSLVGPRPCLLNQTELICERESRNIFDARPGITGLAQINGIDMSSPELLAETDATMLRDINMVSYFKYIIKTVFGSGRGDRIQPRQEQEINWHETKR
jgi:lipopolysaccharide/colanic/teichoic acid biosynthesis glycosyltransferase